MRAKQIAIGLVVVASANSFAANARGFVRPESCSYISRERIHFVAIDGKKLTRQIIFAIPGVGTWDNMLNQWFEDLTTCDQASSCETVVHSKIRLTRVSRSIFIPFRGRRINGLTGDFSVELQNGKQVTGVFRVKTRKPRQLMICE